MKIKYKTGSVREVSKVIGTRLVAAGIATVVEDDKASPTYQTRMMTAEPLVAVSPVVTFQAKTIQAGTDAAPYGYKADGTPRKRPGRTKASE